nr:hypothetical protein HK105_003505 [Polyrhizophydium stewartii]
MDEREAVSVAIRIRPLNSRERAGAADTGAGAWGHDAHTIWSASLVGPTSALGEGAKAAAPGSSAYTFDHIFGPAEPTRTVYDVVADAVVESCMLGVNGTIFAYGQTSSGKTHTMMGDSSEPGIIPLALERVFRHISMVPTCKHASSGLVDIADMQCPGLSLHLCQES